MWRVVRISYNSYLATGAVLLSNTLIIWYLTAGLISPARRVAAVSVMSNTLVGPLGAYYTVIFIVTIII